MTEYWKSLPKKMCDVCKCWLTDNKASIEFHERGVRHKQNVQQRIRDAQQKGKSRDTAKLATDDDMRRIEAAALRAFEKDLHEHPSVASQYGSIKLSNTSSLASSVASSSKARNSPAIPASAPTGSYSSLPAVDETPVKSTREAIKLAVGTTRALETVASIQKKQAEIAASRKWKEAKSDDGYSFFYHVDTMDSRWDAPAEGYESIAEQLEALGDTEVSIPATRTKPLPPSLDQRPSTGNWVTVRDEPEAPEVDYQAPVKSNLNEIADDLYSKAAEDDQTRLQFKTKTVSSLDDVEGVDSTFKKRKFTHDSRRQTKKRDND